ncbi:pheromone A receptor-domain-containing protein [Dactylonectria estremocensis]|uniref:Pheromone A receptor-domain-containing protein n=1 Tax=Dactylonectria estremocensis TaxID=1079267 RepID=A0A9P9FJ57_9HYPO|nr:pheromone A receptor-domain-containing protein [Dactylonectria estremocensis]
MASATDMISDGGASFIFKAPGSEATPSASLMANLVSRVVLGLLANLVCLVPLRHLYRGGEFAAVVFIVNIEVINFKTVVHALIWRNDNTDSWWAGYGLCDVYPYIHNATLSLYVTCLLAMMRNLAQQVGLMRANPLTVRERRRRNLGQALIIFSLPIIQLAWVWPLTAQRYLVASLIGCTWAAWPSWPYIVFFIAAPVAVSMMTVFYAILVYIRFREVAKSTVSALSNNRLANQRAQRARRRLYLMIVSILVPFFPIVVVLALLNIRHATPLQSFEYKTIHGSRFPFPWNTVTYLPSSQLEFAFINNCYINILSAIPVFVFFGMTKNAMNTYRRGCLRLGLGWFFPKLNVEYDPDRDAYGSSGLSSAATGSTNSTTAARIKSLLWTKPYHTVSTFSGVRSTRSRSDALSSIDAEQGLASNHLPHPQSTYSTTVHDITSPAQLVHPNPFLFRTHFNFSTPSKLFPSLFSKKTRYPHSGQALPLGSLISIVQQPRWEPPTNPPNIQTRVWSNSEGSMSGHVTPEVDLMSPLPLNRSVTVETELTREAHQR